MPAGRLLSSEAPGVPFIFIPDQNVKFRLTSSVRYIIIDRSFDGIGHGEMAELV